MHPLDDVLDRLDPEAQYRLPDLADLLGFPLAEVQRLMDGGFLPGSTFEGIPGRGGRRHVWTGRALIAATDAELPDLDHERLSPATLWRLGCGCRDCTAWHNESTRETNRRAADKKFPEQKRRQLLELVAAGTVVTEAAEQIGVTPGQVYGRARRDDEFSAALDKAAEALCVDPSDPKCGTPAAYRLLGCRATACRRAHTPITR